MELSAKQQIVELVKASKRVLLLTHVGPDGDSLGSILALKLALTKLGKEPIAYLQDESPQSFSFMPKINELKSEINSNKDFIITIDTAKTKVGKLSYKNVASDNKLNVILSPKAGNFTIDDVSVGYSQHKFDLVFVLDSPTLERVGSFYEENPDLFYEVPVINIDHHSGNDYFGKINWVELTATSTSEILVALLESLGRDKSIFDADIATCLLTGIITDTGSFQHNNTTPKSLTIAAQLVAAGAKQQDIIRSVYKTKSLSTLKLWGKILSSIKEEKEYSFVYSTVSRDDFMLFGAKESESSGVLDELLKTAPNIDFAMILVEKQNNLHGSLRGTKPGVNVAEIAKLFGGGGHELAAAFSLANTKLLESESMVINKIKEYQKQKYGITSQEGNIITNEEINNYDDYA